MTLDEFVEWIASATEISDRDLGDYVLATELGDVETVRVDHGTGQIIIE